MGSEEQKRKQRNIFVVIVVILIILILLVFVTNYIFKGRWFFAPGEGLVGLFKVLFP